MGNPQKHIIIVGGGTAGSVLASRLTEQQNIAVTLLEAGPDDSSYPGSILEPPKASENWLGAENIPMTPMLFGEQLIPTVQGRMLGGTSAVNGMATLRGLPEDYDSWQAAGLNGWGWQDVIETFKAAETDLDFMDSDLHGNQGPLPVRRWRREEMGHAQVAFQDGMAETGVPPITDINDRSQLPGLGVFPVTINQQGNRVSTSLAYLNASVRERDNLNIRTNAEVEKIQLDGSRAVGVLLKEGEALTADEIVVTSGALWTPNLLMRSGIGPAEHLTEHGITVNCDLPVGETMSDHIGPGIGYQHDGPRGGTAGPAQSLYIGASDGVNPDYHLFPIASSLTDGPTNFLMAVFLLRSSGLGSVKLGENSDSAPIVTVPPLPDDGIDRLRHGFQRVAAWEQTAAFKSLGCTQGNPIDLRAKDAVETALAQLTVSYGHMTSTCPMGSVLDADCRVLGVDGLRVADASAMPTIPSGNTYLGCVMIAERIAKKMLATTS